MSSRRTIFTMEQPGVVAGYFAQSFSLIFLSIFVHISGSIRPVTLIWASLERCLSPAQVEYRRGQFWSKGMMSEVEERPRLITASYGRLGSQWVKATQFFPYFQIIISVARFCTLPFLFHKRQRNSVLRKNDVMPKYSTLLSAYAPINVKPLGGRGGWA